VQIVENIGHSPAILLAKHGVFTIGPTIEKAVQAAVIHLHLPTEITQLFVGVIILVAVGVDLLRQSRRARA